MDHLCFCCNSLSPSPAPVRQQRLQPTVPNRSIHPRQGTITAFAAKSVYGGFSLDSMLKGCQNCGGKGAIERRGCKVPLYNHNPMARLWLWLWRRAKTASTHHSSLQLQVHASQGPRSRRPQKAPPGVDTRIHWENEDEGWVGGCNTSKQRQPNAEKNPKNLLGEKFADLLSTFSGSHYEFLGVSAEADLEEIKAAYRRLSKEYHPDTTSLPLKTASDKFMKLREVYNVLSNEESRRFYDWTLAQEAASRQAEKMNMRLQDPHVQDVKNWEPVPDTVDRLGGKNMKLSDQAVSALTIDVFIIIFAICCIVYVIFFKEPSYY